MLDVNVQTNIYFLQEEPHGRTTEVEENAHAGTGQCANAFVGDG
jgi:hypothetical protein